MRRRSAIISRMTFGNSVACILLLLLGLPLGSFAQKQGGAAATGFGKAYEAAGKTTAARELQRKMNTTLLRAISRAGGSRSTAVPFRKAPAIKGKPSDVAPAPTAPQNSYAVFTPDPASNYSDSLADTIGSTPEEKAAMRQLFAGTKTSFEQEVAKNGRSNNLSAAFTFFIASAVTVYHDDPEPSDEAVDKLWDGMSSTLDEMPELAGLTNDEKQQMYDTLVSFSGLVLAGHMLGKQTGDKEMQRLYKQLSATLIQTVLKTEPDKLRFGRSGLNVVN
jgi:hypothetical protein